MVDKQLHGEERNFSEQEWKPKISGETMLRKHTCEEVEERKVRLFRKVRDLQT